MHSLHITSAAPNQLRTLRAVRQAMGMFPHHEDADLASDAAQALRALDRDGCAYIGVGPRESCSAAQGILDDAGCGSSIDLDTERFARRRATMQDAAEGRTPEEVFAARAPGDPRDPVKPADPLALAPGTFLALSTLTICNGDPIKAAAHLHSLSRSGVPVDPFREAQDALVAVFPWIHAPLVDSQLRIGA